MANASDSDSDASLSGDSTTSSSSSSALSSPPSLAPRSGADVAGGEPVELTKLRLRREQKLRQMLSQRHLGRPEPIAHNAFFSTRSTLSEEDVVWLYALTNPHCFEGLLREVAATQASLAGHLDAVLSNANPLFHFAYRMALEGPSKDARREQEEEGRGVDHSSRVLRTSPLMQQWAETTAPIERKRPAPEDDAHGASSKAVSAEGDAAGGARKASKTAAATSASSGLVAQSMMAWEAHLTDALTREGETVESFRQARSKASYTDKKTFQQQAEWKEFEREVALQQQQRDREATRALRRGEVEER